MGLIDVNFTPATHVKETLLGMDIGFGCDPGRRVNGTTQGTRGEIFPLDREGNGIFRGHAARLGHPRRGRGRDPHGFGNPVQGPFGPIDVMGIEIIGNIGRFSRPGLEGFELMFGLGHVGREVLKVAHGGAARAIAGIGIEGIQSFVDFDGHQDVVLGGRGTQGLVLCERLHNGFGHHDVQSALNGRQANIKVRIVRGKDNHHIAGLVGLYGGQIGRRVDRVVGGKGLAARRVHVTVDPVNVRPHVRPNAGKLFAVDAAHANARHFCATAQIKHGERHDAGALVAVGRAPAHVARRVFARAHHEHVGRLEEECFMRSSCRRSRSRSRSASHGEVQFDAS